MQIKGLIQIAGVIDAREADLICSCGVNCLGFPLRLPVHKEDLSEEQAARIIKSLKPPHSAVLITYLEDASEVLQLCDFLGAAAVQLHGEISPSETARLRSLKPSLGIFKSLVVRGDNAQKLEASVRSFSDSVDAFITDTFDPATGACGATGKTHDWSISRKLVSISPKPVILAGGLNPDNVLDAIRYVRPAGVDAHTGVEAPGGRKSRELLEKFVAAARQGFLEEGTR